MIRESGNTAILVAFAMTALAAVMAVLIDLVQVRQAQIVVEAAAQAAVVDGARVDVQLSLLGQNLTEPARRLAIPNSTGTGDRVRHSLAANLESLAYLMDGTTPAQVASQAEIAIVNPVNGDCEPNPVAPAGLRAPCYYDPFIGMRVIIPMKALWGSVRFEYQVVVVGALTDNEQGQRPATPMPTSTPAPVPTFPLPLFTPES